MKPEVSKTLKAGWRRVKFGDVVQLAKGRSQDPLADGFDRYVGLEHLEPGDLRIRSWGNVADGVTFTNVFQPGQVLFGKRRAYQRKVAVADFSGVCSGDIYVLETKDAQLLLPELLPFICQTDAFFDHAVGTSAGSLSPRTNWTSLADFEFSLPPIAEQKYAAQVLGAFEEQVESVKEAIEALRKVKAAFVERLVATTSKSRPIVALTEVCLRVTDGTHQPPAFTQQGVPFFLVKTISSGFVDWTCTNFVSRQTFEELTRRVKPKRGDVLYTAVGATYGVALMVDFDETFVFQRHIAHIIPNPQKIVGRYIEEFLNSRLGKRLSDQSAVGSAQPTVTLKSLSNFKLPLPTIDEQRAFVEEIEKITAAFSTLGGRLRSSLELRAKALNGMLA
ncbi:MAG: restriction endonuclease subunit S [Rhodoferax sp.]|nr:restriction endonuclease subunit S [Rhodoferax sp.]